MRLTWIRLFLLSIAIGYVLVLFRVSNPRWWKPRILLAKQEEANHAIDGRGSPFESMRWIVHRFSEMGEMEKMEEKKSVSGWESKDRESWNAMMEFLFEDKNASHVSEQQTKREDNVTKSDVKEVQVLKEEEKSNEDVEDVKGNPKQRDPGRTGPSIVHPTPPEEGYKLDLSTFVSDEELLKNVVMMHENAKKNHPQPEDADHLLDRGDELESLDTRLFFINMLYNQTKGTNKARVCIVSVTSADVWGLRRSVFPWIQYHMEEGIEHFYIFYDGSDSQALGILRKLHAVSVVPIRAPFGDSSVIEDLERFQKGHKQWGGRPGNYELMVKQAFAINRGIEQAKSQGMDWIMHLDQDELFVGEVDRSSNVADILHSQPSHVCAVKFFNNEAYPEREDVVNPFDQVTLFKVNTALLSKSADPHRWKGVIGQNGRMMLLYGNGKTVARVDAPGLKQLGPHEFWGPRSERWITESNPNGEWKTQQSDRSTILHYSYCTLDTIIQKAERSCPPEYKEAAIRNDRSKTKECFVLDFDQEAYHVAARGNKEEIRSFYLSRIVFEQGATGKCTHEGKQGHCIIEDLEGLKTLLLRQGVLHRYLLPRQVLRMHERVIQNLLTLTSHAGT